MKLTNYPVDGKYGKYGGRFVPEVLMEAIKELEEAYESAYKDLHEKLIKSYALDSMVPNNDIKSNVNIDMANEFIEEILKSNESKNESVGYGFDYRFASQLYTGSSLVYNNEVIHVSFFKSINADDNGEMKRYNTRANLRQY